MVKGLSTTGQKYWEKNLTNGQLFIKSINTFAVKILCYMVISALGLGSRWNRHLDFGVGYF